MRRKVTRSVALLLVAAAALAVCGIQVAFAGGSSEAPAAKGPTTLTALVQHTSWGPSDMVNNTARTFFEDKMNVKLNLVVVEDSVLNDKINLMMSSGDYPDVFFGAGFGRNELLKYGVQEKILVPLNDLIDKYGIETKKLLAEFKDLRADITAPDGNIYGLPNVSDSKHEKQPYKYWIESEWVKKLGYQLPKTTDELKTVLTAFRNKDPNGNGKADEVPLSGAANTWAADPWVYLVNSFILCDPGNSYLILKNNQFSFAGTDPKFQEGLKYVRGLYQAGLIDPASFTQDLNQLGKLGGAPEEILGCFSAGHLAMAIDINNMKDRSRAFTALPPVLGPDGTAQTPTAAQAGVLWFPFAITTKCKDPAVAFKCGDYLLSDEFTLKNETGDLGTDYELAKAGDKGLMGGDAKYRYLTPADKGKPNNRTWGAHSQLTDALLNRHRDLFMVSQDMYDPANYLLRLYRESDKYFPFAQKSQIITPFFTDPDTSSKLAQMGNDIRTYVATSVLEFITGKKDLDGDWKAYVAGFDKLKLAEFLALEKKAYDGSRGVK